MKYLFLLLILLLAAVPYMARAEDFSAQNKGLPAVYKRVGFRQSYYCAVVKITNADERIRDHIGQEFSLDDIGSYAVLKEFHINGAGGDGYPRILERRAMSLVEASAQLNTNPDCGAGEKELSEKEWHEEFQASFEKDMPVTSAE